VVDLFGERVRVPSGGGLSAGTDATIVIRPESIRVDSGALRGTVRRATFLGPLAEYDIEVADGVLTAVDSDWMERPLHAVGDVVSWSLRSEQAYALPPGGPTETAPEDPEAVAEPD
jgi:hypothetical protein